MADLVDVMYPQQMSDGLHGDELQPATTPAMIEICRGTTTYWKLLKASQVRCRDLCDANVPQ
jgi:hypothetical protein